MLMSFISLGETTSLWRTGGKETLIGPWETG